jgi:signal transduction histidine kinase
MMISSLEVIEEKENELTELFLSFEKEFLKILDVVSSLKANVSSIRDIEEVNIKEAIKRVLNILESKIKRQNIKIEEIYDASLPLVKADSNDINQVFLNIFQNSLYALEGIISNPKIRITVSVEGKHTMSIETEDNGVGISEENQDKIFKPGFTTKKGGGFGLGLGICRRLLRSYGGNVILKESVPLKGTIFLVKLSLIRE